MNLLDVSKRVGGIERFIHVSTDEVYGSRTTGSFKEEDKLNPSSPYSSSKAAAELLALSYFRTHQTPVIITRSANNYGPYQFPEKLLPLFITNLLDGKKIPLMWSSENPGLNVRDWLHVEDNCRAIWQVSQKGQVGEAYNIPGENERTNVEITNIILGILGVGEEMIERVAHREGHDFRYAISGDKLRSIGYKPQHLDLQKGIEETVVWYKQNQKWWRPLKN
jgi:dTDP-glucose 4,6-dehydratase